MAYVVPKDVRDPEHVAREVSGILGLDYEETRAKVLKPDDPFEILKKKLSQEEIDRLQQAQLEGVHMMPEKYRYYPGNELAAHVVGFANLDNTKNPGYGIEAFFNEELGGKSGEVKQERDAAGRWIPLSDRDVVQVEQGDDIVLTLDKTIQHQTEQILKDSIEKYKADAATAIVLDPKTGKILAMASVPTFDPNNYRSVTDYGVFLNPTVSGIYEPGSIMKPITMAMGLEEGKVTPTSTYVDPGVVKIAGYSIHNAEDKTYGLSDMYKVLDQSINTGAIYVEDLVGNEKFRSYLERLGFGEKTGIDLPAELSGNLRNLANTNHKIQFYTASFGQGMSATPIEMTMAYGALANGGVLMKPQLIEKVIKDSGESITIEPEEVRRVFSEKTSKEMGDMLRSVVVNGHGKRADVPGYLVGGKTGTAQVAKEGSKGYEEGISIGSFVGYAPIQDPKYVVFVKLDNPKNVEWAESSAAPAFGEIMKFLLEYGRVAPTETPKN
jgi:cell division protein FtsI/penicillin-binding protein 2